MFYSKPKAPFMTLISTALSTSFAGIDSIGMYLLVCNIIGWIMAELSCIIKQLGISVLKPLCKWLDKEPRAVKPRPKNDFC